MKIMPKGSQITNILIIELSTMIVAIALAFNAEYLNGLGMIKVIMFIMTNIIVIWFWWQYVMDRLRFPPKDTYFPILDVIVLIMISMIPFVIERETITFALGFFIVFLVAWTFLMRMIREEYRAQYFGSVYSDFNFEAIQRYSVVGLFMASYYTGMISSELPMLVLMVCTIAMITWNLSPLIVKSYSKIRDPSKQFMALFRLNK